MVFFYQNCSDLLWEKMFQWSRKTFEIWGWRSRICKFSVITRTNYSNSEWTEQFLVTECFFNLFLEIWLNICSTFVICYVTWTKDPPKINSLGELIPNPIIRNRTVFSHSEGWEFSKKKSWNCSAQKLNKIFNKILS